LLAQCHGLVKDGLKEGQNLRQTEKLSQILPFLVLELVIAEHLHVGDGRHGGRMLGNEPPQMVISRLGRVDEDIAVVTIQPQRGTKGTKVDKRMRTLTISLSKDAWGPKVGLV